MDVVNVVDNTKVYMMDGVTTLAAVIANINVRSSAPSTSIGTGEIIYRSDLGYLQVNTGTAGSPTWTDVAAGTYLPLSGGTMTGAIGMNGNAINLNSGGTSSIQNSGSNTILKVPSGGYLVIQVG